MKSYPCYFKLYVPFDFPFSEFLINIAEFLRKTKVYWILSTGLEISSFNVTK